MLPLFKNNDFMERAVSPMRELGAYEALWLEDGTSFKTLADRFKKEPGSIPSDFVPLSKAMEFGCRAQKALKDAGVERFGVRVHGAGEYPEKLRDARHPIELLYYSGLWQLVETPCVSVVGTRELREEGASRTRKITKLLVNAGYTIVSGLAKGVDAVAHRTAIDLGGRTIGVLGTPLSLSYPPENRELQKYIADNFLVVSQVPVLRYSQTNPTSNRFFFPERNVTMSALTLATIIIEAGETSGTLHQARAALQQKRKLFILDSLFQRKELTWPDKYLKLGAIRVKDFEEIKTHLGAAPCTIGC